MKKTIFVLALSIFLFWACSETTNVTAPEQSNTEHLLKFKSDSQSSLFKSTISQSINGETGGTIPIDLASADGEFAVTGEIVFPENCFAGTEEITISVAGDLAALDFGPSLVFQNSVNLNLSLSGVDVTDDDNVGFKYIQDSGDLLQIEYSNIAVNVSEAEVLVEEAQLNHFSRYGFTK